MRWKQYRRSDNVEDRRGQSGQRRRGFPLPIPMGRGGGGRRGGGIGCGAIVLILVALYIFGGDPLNLLTQIGGGGTATQPQQQTRRQQPQTQQQKDEAGEFASSILAMTEDVWGDIFRQSGSRYQEPGLVRYSGSVNSACGYNTAATGPFYCPGDNKLYLDMSFMRELKRMGAGGDFAMAYVIAHEIGHHVQNATGIERQVRQMQRRARSQSESNQLQVAMELQADCYAGVWANHIEPGILERGDIEEGLNAAAAVGDDHLQKMAGRRVQPEAFTHGSSKQRMQWFRRGFDSGRINSCDTFN